MAKRLNDTTINIFAAENPEINITKSGIYRIFWRGLKTEAVINIGKNLNVTISEKYCPKTSKAEAKYIIGEDAAVAISAISDCSKSMDISHKVEISRGGRFDVYSAYTGGSVNDVWQVFSNEGSEVNINIVSFSALSEVHRHKVFTRQLEGDSNVNVNCRGVAIDNSVCGFTTQGNIDKGAARATAYHKSKVMVLSDTAVAEVDPSLYIDEYDVKAGHSGSVGRVGRDILYYLMSRGLNEKQVINLITTGFLSELVANFSDPRDLGKLYKAIHVKAERV